MLANNTYERHVEIGAANGELVANILNSQSSAALADDRTSTWSADAEKRKSVCNSIRQRLV